jgi:mRNA interferase MazF
MVAPLIGDVVLIPFPFSDLTRSKKRPALVLASVGLHDFVLCQITSKPYDDRLAIPLSNTDFSQGGINKASFIRIGKLFTANASIMIGVAGKIQSGKLTEVLLDVSRLFVPHEQPV